jgi:hypothetical protein
MCSWYCSAGDSVGVRIGAGTCAIVLSATLATRGLFRDSTGAGAIGAGSAMAAAGAGASGSATTATAGATGGALGARFAFGAGGGGGSGIGSTACGMGSGVGSTTCAIGSMVSKVLGLLRLPLGRPLPLFASAPAGSGCSIGSIFFIWRKKTHLFKRRRVTRPLIAGAVWPACNIAFPRAVCGVGWVRNVGASVFLAWSRYRSGPVVPRSLYFT